MKKYFLILLCLILLKSAHSQSLFEQSLVDIDGVEINLRKFFGKKTLFIILPLSVADSVKITAIKNFQAAHSNRVRVVGILSVEDGYNIANKEVVKALYAGSTILITEGLYTHQVSGSSQAGLLQWLTKKEKNLRSDQDVTGVGQGFLTGEAGNLLLVIKPSASLTDPGLLNVINKTQ